jgi:type IV secretory pathway VirB10-like protein
MRAYGWLVPAVQVKQPWADETNGHGIKSKISYPVENRVTFAEQNGRDLTAEELEKLRRALLAIEARLGNLENQPKPKAQVIKSPEQPKAPPKARPMMFVSNKLDLSTEDDPDTYALVPGATKLPCVVETTMNSDVPSFFTARVRNDIYDTATGHKLLVPQGSTILGDYQSATLVFGNERLPALSPSLALPDGRSVDLGRAPVMNQAGMAGLVSRVNQHWWRNIGAVLIMGVLRGGQLAVASEFPSTEGASGAVAAGMASSVGQFGQQKLTRTIDTRPTIEVDAGSLCTVLLTKPLKLPEVARR